MTTALTTIQTQQQEHRNRLSRMHAIIQHKQKQIQLALPKQGGLTADRMTRIVLTAISMNKALWNCTDESLLAAVMQAAQLGLEPDGALGMASLVPYGNRVQLIIGYRGYIQLALRSGQLKDIRSRCVYEGDDFEVVYGLVEDIRHRPQRVTAEGLRTLEQLAADGMPPMDAEPVAVYGVAEFKNGGRHFEVLWPEDIMRIRNSSRGWQHPESPWQKHKAAMWRKTAIKQTLKYCPMAAEDRDWVTRADQADEREYSNLQITDDGEVISDDDQQQHRAQVQVPAAPPPPTTKADEFVQQARPRRAQAAQAPAAPPAPPAPPAAPAAPPAAPAAPAAPPPAPDVYDEYDDDAPAAPAAPAAGQIPLFEEEEAPADVPDDVPDDVPPQMARGYRRRGPKP